MEIVDLRKKPLLPEISELLTASMGSPRPSELWKAWHDYSTNHNHRIFGVSEEGKVVGLIGVELRPDGIGTIQHLAVTPPHQRRGIAKRLVAEIVSRFPNHVVRAEADHRITMFYGHCGFEVRKLEQKFPGPERFVCEKRPR